MDKEYRTPQNPQATEAPVNHSGNLPDAMRDVPVTNFDNTPLSQFEDIQRNNVPMSPATLPENMPPFITTDHPDAYQPTTAFQAPTSERREVKKGSKRNLFIGLGSGAAALALAAGAAFGVGAVNEALKPKPVATAPADPSEAPSANPTPESSSSANQAENESKNAEKIKSLEIKAGLTPNLLGTSIIDVLNKWSNEGCDGTAKKKLIDDAPATESMEDTAKRVATENSAPYAIALFGENYEENNGVKGYVNQSIASNADVLAAYGSTAYNAEHPGEPYKYWTTLSGDVTDLGIGDVSGSKRIAIAYDNHDNSDKNIVTSNMPKGGLLTVDYIEIDGHVVVTKIVTQAR